ncbi:autotransporter outer membrane beta-barrel domain-containing protein [Aurantivibrio plasticivorans]
MFISNIKKLIVASGMLAAQLGHTADTDPSRVIVFGDSLSDGGFYSAILPYPAGQSFTTNPDPVAPEVFAAQLGLPLAPVYGEGGTNFAIGGARVTLPNAIAVPITSQIDGFIANGGQFGDNDVVYIQGGGNDVFAFAAGGGVDPTIVSTAAVELADQVARLQDAGAKRIVTLAIQSGGAAVFQGFNQVYKDRLVANQVNALFFDTDALFNELVIDAAAFGYTNILDPACGAVDSLDCGPADYVTPDANETHIQADDVHPAGKTQRIQGQAIASLMISPEQIGQLSYAAQSLFQSQSQLNRSQIRRASYRSAQDTAVFINVGNHQFDNGNTLQVTSLEEDSVLLSAGVDYLLAADTHAGVAIGLSDGDGEFTNNRGDYNVDSFSTMFYVNGRNNNLALGAELLYGVANYEDLTRSVQLGPVIRQHVGDTEASVFGLSAHAGYELGLGSTWFFVPRIGLDFQSIDIDGYSESDSLSTGATFGSQKLKSLNVQLGMSVQALFTDSFQLYADLQLNNELKDDERRISVTPNGAPISYRSALYIADDQYLTAEFGGAFSLGKSIALNAGVRSVSGRDDTSATLYFVGAEYNF